jgi:hypothetical protein
LRAGRALGRARKKIAFLYAGDTLPGMRDEILTACKDLFGWSTEDAPSRVLAVTLAELRTAYRVAARATPPATAERQRIDGAYHRILCLLAHQGSKGPTCLALPAPVSETRALPQRPLCLGQFLYYQGRVAWDAVQSALRWQRSSRPRFGELAREWRLLNDDQIRVVRRARRPRERFGDTARRLGYAKRDDLETLAKIQRVSERRIGQYFVEQGALTAAEMCVLVQHQREHNRRYARRA